MFYTRYSLFKRIYTHRVGKLILISVFIVTIKLHLCLSYKPYSCFANSRSDRDDDY